MRKRTSVDQILARIMARRFQPLARGGSAAVDGPQGLPKWMRHCGMAIACAAALHTAGCLRAPGGDVAHDLRDNAKKAAIQAQQEIEAKKRGAAVAAAESRSVKTAPEGIASATEQQRKGTAAPSKPRTNPLAEYLKRGKTSPAKEDPFVVAQASASTAAESQPAQPAARSLTSVSRADAEWEAILEEKLALAKRRRRQNEGGYAPHIATDSEPRPVEAVAPMGESAPKPRPFPAADVAQVSSTTTAQPRRSNGIDPAPTGHPMAEPSHERAGGMLQGTTPIWMLPPSDASALSRGSVVDREDEPVQDSKLQSQLLPRIEARTAQESALANNQLRSSGAYSLLPREAGQSEKARVRLELILDQAHAQYEQGDLHAAYRSALLAQRIAETENVAFAAGEELPGQFAEAIAQELWGTPLAADAADSIPTISPRPAPTTSAELGGTTERAEQLPAEQPQHNPLASAFGIPDMPIGWHAADADLSESGSMFTSAGSADSAGGIPFSSDPSAPPFPGMESASARAAATEDATSGDLVGQQQHAATASWETDGNLADRSSITLARVETASPTGSASWGSLSAHPAAPLTQGEQEQWVAVPAPPANTMSDGFDASGAVELQTTGLTDSGRLSLNGTEGGGLGMEAPPSNPGSPSNDQAPPSGGGLLWAVIGFLAAATATVVGLRVHRARTTGGDDAPDAAAATLPLTRKGGTGSGSKGTFRAA